MLDYLPWVMAAMALVLAITAVLVAARAAAFGRRVLHHLEATSRREGMGRHAVGPAAPPQSADGRGPTSQQIVEWARDGFTSYGRRIQEIENDLDLVMAELAKGKRHEAAGEGRPGDRGGDELNGSDGSTVAPSVARNRSEMGGQPVEIRDGLIVPSRSLAAVGSLVPGTGASPALLYLNETVEIDHLSQNRWAQFFDFGGGEPYRRYRTVEPSKS